MIIRWTVGCRAWLLSGGLALAGCGDDQGESRGSDSATTTTTATATGTSSGYLGRAGPWHIGFGPPPAQIPACGTTAPGSCLGFWRESAPLDMDDRLGWMAAIEL